MFTFRFTVETYNDKVDLLVYGRFITRPYLISLIGRLGRVLGTKAFVEKSLREKNTRNQYMIQYIAKNS